MAIALGTHSHPLRVLMETDRCTWFAASQDARSARKHWIAGGLVPAGRLHIDAGAVRALQDGSSLLPAGVTSVEGTFNRGDLVQVVDPEGRIVARGVVAYSARDARRIAGFRSEKIESLLGWHGRDEIIHRDDMVAD